LDSGTSGIYGSSPRVCAGSVAAPRAAPPPAKRNPNTKHASGGVWASGEARARARAQDAVQPRMMEQVVSCRDDIAQQYLMLCVIQGFPDECHLRTLPALLAALPELQPGVRVHLILGSLLDRLARCAHLAANGE